MKNSFSLTFFVALLTVSLFTQTAFTQEGPDFSLDLSYMSHYIWRGAVFAEKGVFQPSFTGSMDELSINLWGNMDSTDENGLTRKINEWDYTIDYSRSIESVSISVGIIGYTFPNVGGHTTELYVGAGYDMPGSPSITIYQDLEAVEGTYVSLGAGYSIPIPRLTSLDISGSLGFASKKMNGALYGAADTSAGFSDVLVSLSLPFTITEYASATPFVALSSILNSDGKDTYDTNGVDATNIFFGLIVSTSF
jgi:hypothetical protein